MAIQPFLTEARIRACTESGHWRNRTIIDYLDQHADTRPEHLAVVDHNSETGLRTALSYRQLRHLVDRMALGFTQLGGLVSAKPIMNSTSRWRKMGISGLVTAPMRTAAR